ncbi:sigma-70 family RNA polymerase sigma factor [Paenibacillus sp.]|uniref:sigma-70 family RNA polymerase sigma factor n=1 Tax=Paenibacillus sp. TaxID=58172 RepID=UPI002D38D6F9|nr:sigma-70 family RNA polymerase sigma factor [Paenibacillus sp.]HZG85639.1 sigma-70 family RNA polymerase sigma factor [Paenibacillus sp.]
MTEERLVADTRPMLLRLAYRILGSYADAEDVVQDTYLEISGRDLSDIRQPKAYLTKAVANRCLNLLKSARKTRESYIGPWLPEPAPALPSNDPEALAEKRETLSYAFVVLLQRLSPEERVAFVLREALGYAYRDIAAMLGKSETACRQTISRARRKLPPPPAGGDAAREAAGEDAAAAERFARQFLAACETGDFRGFVTSLSADARLVTDAGGKVRAATRVIYGSERIEALFRGIAPKGFFDGEASLIRQGGQIGVRLGRGSAAVWAAFFELEPNRRVIQTMYMVLNPEKLTRV